MRLLPILWDREPTPEDWARLSAAREAAGIAEKIQPANAYPGSPQPILAVGNVPPWLTDYVLVDSALDGAAEALAEAMDRWRDPPTGEKYATVLSTWMGAEVKYVEEVEFDEPVG